MYSAIRVAVSPQGGKDGVRPFDELFTSPRAMFMWVLSCLFSRMKIRMRSNEVWSAPGVAPDHGDGTAGARDHRLDVARLAQQVAGAVAAITRGGAVEVAEPLILGHDLCQILARAVVLAPIQPIGLHRLHDLEASLSIIAVCRGVPFRGSCLTTGSTLG